MAASPTTTPPTPSSSTLRVGVLIILPDVQLLDVSPVDLFAMCSTEYLQACHLPPPLTRLGLDVSIVYISTLPVGAQLSTTGALTLVSTAHVDDAAVQPGALDILLIPGPPPDTVPSAAEQAFLRAHASSATTDILCVCTGVVAAAHAGIADGKRLTAPRALIPGLQKTFPAVTFDSDVRWAADGRLWASGGITNGQEMVAAYLRRRWPGPLSDTVCALADVGEKNRLYDSSPSKDTGWFVWQIVRSLWTSKKAK